MVEIWLIISFMAFVVCLAKLFIAFAIKLVEFMSDREDGKKNG